MKVSKRILCRRKEFRAGVCTAVGTRFESQCTHLVHLHVQYREGYLYEQVLGVQVVLL